MIIKGIKVKEYLDSAGRNPFREWLGSLPVETGARIFRIEAGNLGTSKPLGMAYLKFDWLSDQVSECTSGLRVKR